MMNGKDCTISVLGKHENIKIMKRASFDSNVKIQYLHAWSFAYREARKSEWMRHSVDRYRFDLRRQKLEALLVEIGFFSRQNMCNINEK